MSAQSTENEPELCPVCGEPMVTEDGQTHCPKCAAQIDWGLEDAEDGGEEQ